MSDAPPPRLGVRLLGAVEVEVAGEVIDVRSLTHRALLSILALRAGHPVPVQVLIDGLWGEKPPPTAANALRVHVSAIRRLLGPAAVRLRTHPVGYLLDVPAADVDALAFERAVTEARAGSAAALASALRHWRGDPFPGVAGLPFAEAEAERLHELYLSALGERVEADLAAGRHGDLLDELSALVRAHPYRESFWRQLMIALYRDGQQAAALDRYRQVSAVLADELGIDPGPALQAVHRAVLAQDLPSVSGPALPPLPATSGPFLGRAGDLAALTDLLAASRLVTVVGPGGIGKTRLALEFAHAMTNGRRWATSFLTLADVTETAVAEQLAVDRVDGLLGLRSAAGRLLVLDNLEHLPKVAEVVLRLAGEHRLHILGTSRSPLHLAAEAVHPLRPLGPDAAAELFRHHMDRLGGETAPDRSGRPASDLEHRQAVQDICRRVDGLPLGIRLAAARTRLLSVTDIARRLDQARLPLRLGSADLPDRHRDLEATVAWSLRLLDPGARRLFGRLGVFASWFRAADAGTVCGAGDEIDDALEALVDASLVDAGPSGLRLLHILRQHARREAAGDPDWRATNDRHAVWVARRSAAAIVGLDGASEAQAVQELTVLTPDLRAAIDHLATTAPDDAAALLIDNRQTFYVQGLMTEYADRIDRLADLDVSDDTRHDLALIAAVFAKLMDRADAHRRLSELVDTPSRTRPTLSVNALCHLAALESVRGEHDRAADHGRRAVDIARAAGVPLPVLGMAFDLCAYVAKGAGDLDGAAAAIRAAVEIGRRHGSSQLAESLANLAEILALGGHTAEALDAALEAFARVGDSMPTRRAMVAVSVVQALGPDTPDPARRALTEGIAFLAGTGTWSALPGAFLALTRLAGDRADHTLARLGAALTSRIASPELDREVAAVRSRLSPDAWLDASRDAARTSVDDIIELVGALVVPA